jgi:ferritin
MQFLDWFVKEQGEEEKNTEDIIKKYDLFGNDTRGLYLLDAELATRIYTPATLVI